MPRTLLKDEYWTKLLPILRDLGVYCKPNLRRCKMQFCVTFSCISLYLIFLNGYHKKAATKIKNPRERQSSRGLMVGPVGFEPTTKGL